LSLWKALNCRSNIAKLWNAKGFKPNNMSTGFIVKKVGVFRRLHIMSGRPGRDTPGSSESLLQNLRAALPILEENEIVGLIEPINNYSVPGYFLNNYDTG